MGCPKKFSFHTDQIVLKILQGNCLYMVLSCTQEKGIEIYLWYFWPKKNGATTINLPFLLFLSIESLSKDVFEGRTSTGSEPFSLFICLDANKFVLLSFFSLMRRIYPRVSNKPLPNNAKGPLPVDVRRSTTLLLKLPNNIVVTLAFDFSSIRRTNHPRKYLKRAKWE